MPPRSDLKNFPDVEAKLQRPGKQSAFDKQRADAEAKRMRDAAETQAALAEFEKSFENGDGKDVRGFSDTHDRLKMRPPAASGAPLLEGRPSTSKRHLPVSGSNMRSGLGSKAGRGPLDTPSSLHEKKRSFREFTQQQSHKEKGIYGNNDRDGASLTVSNAFNSVSDDEDESMDQDDRKRDMAVAKPTLRLSNLPPGISQSAVKALMPSILSVEAVRIQSIAPSSSERRSAVAIVVLSQETPVTDIESAVSLLQNQYLGYGYYLTLHRHLSSAVTTSETLGNINNISTSQPFGAKPVARTSGSNSPSMRQGFQKGYAPPPSYDMSSGVNRRQLLHVPVKPPQDIMTLQLIHKTIEGVIENGPEFEALLMTRPEVRKDKKWAWLWNARSEGGVWYRWKLWEIVTGSTGKGGKYVPLFEDSPAWKRPEKQLPFEYVIQMDELVSDEDYDTSDNEDLEEGHRENLDADEANKEFLNPLQKAKLVHLLARLPQTHLRIRKGDIARVTAFALLHATQGVDEVVDIVVSNIEKPFSLTGANPNLPSEIKEGQKQGATEEPSTTSEPPEVSAACLVGLYLIHDILSSSATNNFPRAWRYRQLFETALRERRVFERLGFMPERFSWGRLRAEKWKRSVLLVLNQWKANDLFPAASHELFTSTFENPITTKEVGKTEKASAKSKWKALEPTLINETDIRPADVSVSASGLTDGSIDVVTSNMGGDETMNNTHESDVEGEAIEDDDIEGEPIADDDIDGVPIGEEMLDAPEERVDGDDSLSVDREGLKTRSQLQPRKRMRAADMFASSDESDQG